MLKKQSLYIFLTLSCAGLLVSNLNAATFQNNTSQKFSYMFVPGMISIETQTAKYLPEFVGSSGETITCNGGIHTLNLPISTCIFSETTTQSLSTKSMNPFAHLGYWITDSLNKKYGVSIRKDNPQPSEQDYVQDQMQSPAFSVEKHSFDLTKLNLAQEADINALLKAYTEHCQKYPDTNLIMYGVSRGAATICTFMAKHQPENVKALILEAPFDSIPHLFKHWTKAMHLVLTSVLPKVSSYDPNGDSPIKSIENISKDVPLLFVGSRADGVIRLECVKALKRKCDKLGRKNVHLLILDKSSHSGYAFDDAADKLKYESVVHAFYKHYHLPHDENLAIQGTEEWKKISGEAPMMPSNP